MAVGVNATHFELVKLFGRVVRDVVIADGEMSPLSVPILRM